MRGSVRGYGAWSPVLPFLDMTAPTSFPAASFRRGKTMREMFMHRTEYLPFGKQDGSLSGRPDYWVLRYFCSVPSLRGGFLGNSEPRPKSQTCALTAADQRIWHPTYPVRLLSVLFRQGINRQGVLVHY